MSCEGTAWGCHSQVRVCEYVWGGSLSPRPALRRLSSHRYFGFITKHPADHRFACHVFVSEESTKALAESVGYARVCVCVSCLAPALEQAPALGPRAHPSALPALQASWPRVGAGWSCGVAPDHVGLWALPSTAISPRKYSV